MSVLAINAGSSSIRFALFEGASAPLRVCGGKLDRIGHPEATLRVSRPGAGLEEPCAGVNGASFPAAVASLLRWLEAQPWFATVEAVGHRVVHGMRHTDPQRASAELLAELKGVGSLDPEHLPQEINLIEALTQKFPRLPQVLCFDTAFHRELPRRAALLPIPRRYEAAGIRRYGFHGLSYTYLMRELGRLQVAAARRGRVILAHLGSGASLAAVHDGHCIDTTMGLTPTGGLMMATRCGDLDPGVLLYLADSERMGTAALRRTLNHESGLLGVSEISGDVRDLLSRERRDVRAAEAIELFCYRARLGIAAFAAALGGVDTVVFAGGIGENSADVRARICEGLGFIGIALDASRNERSADVISTGAAAVEVRVIRTDEESVIATLAAEALSLRSTGEQS